MKNNPRTTPRPLALYARVREILAAAQTGITRTVNTTQVVASWLIGREIVEEEQQGRRRADYGRNLVENLARRITQDFGPGYSAQNLFYMKQFYLAYPTLLPRLEILHAVRRESSDAAWTHYRTLLRVEKSDARSFYEIEAIQNNWSARELERQINSLLYERLALRSASSRTRTWANWRCTSITLTANDSRPRTTPRWA